VKILRGPAAVRDELSAICATDFFGKAAEGA